jgi:hypothetical protein
MASKYFSCFRSGIEVARKRFVEDNAERFLVEFGIQSDTHMIAHVARADARYAQTKYRFGANLATSVGIR